MKRIGRTLAIVALASCALTACSSGPDSDRDSSTSETRALGTAEEMVAVTPAAPVTSAGVGSADVGAEQAVPQSNSYPSTSASSLPSPGENSPAGVAAAETAESPTSAEGRTPEEIVAEAGPRGQDYLRALRARGVPSLGMDSIEISFANGTCAALGSGMPRTEVLNEFDSVGEALASGVGLDPGQVAEAYVSAAEQAYC